MIDDDDTIVNFVNIDSNIHDDKEESSVFTSISFIDKLG